TKRNNVQNICSHRPLNVRRTTTMLPIAPRRPITAYNTATTSPPTIWPVEPDPATRFLSSAVSIFVASSRPLGEPNAASRNRLGGTACSSRRQIGSGQITALLRCPRHQHCKDDCNEDERSHVSEQMAMLHGVVDGLNAHDRRMNEARPHGEPDEAFVRVGI